MALVSICVIFASQVVFWFLGDQVLNEYILSRKQDSKVESFIKYVYLLSVCSSLTLLELLACEILDIIPRSLRWFLWKFNLFILLNLLIFLIPFIQARVLFFHRSTTPYPKLLIVMFLVYLWFIYKLGSLFPLMDPSVSTSLFSIEQGISRVGIVGITLMAFISGYGSVSGPATYIFVKQVSYDQVESAEKNYLHTQKLLEERREAFQKYCEQKISGNNSSDSSTINWFLKRVSTAMSMNPNSQESLAEEITDLELVLFNLKCEFDTLSNEHDLHTYSKTLNGKLLKVFSHLLYLYCIYRICSAFLNIILNRVGRADPVTVAIGFFVNILGFVDWDIQLWSKEISLIFVGFIIVSSIRNFLAEILKLFKIVDRHEYSKTLTLFSSYLIGLYVTSTILMLRLNLHPENRPLLTEILAAVKFDFFEKWFDIIYICSAISSGAYIYFSRNK